MSDSPRAADPRTKERKRTVLFTLKLYPEENDALRSIAERNFRTPGDQVRYWINADKGSPDV